MGFHTIRHCFNENISNILINASLTGDCDVLFSTDWSITSTNYYTTCALLNTECLICRDGSSWPITNWELWMDGVTDDKARIWKFSKFEWPSGSVFTCRLISADWSCQSTLVKVFFTHNHSMLQAQVVKKKIPPRYILNPHILPTSVEIMLFGGIHLI